jgi:hypothetical protein
LGLAVSVDVTFAVSPPEVDSAVVADPLLEEDSEPDAARDLPGAEVAERSFFAQPEPLKWMVGLPIAFRSVPIRPQFGQVVGPAS